jgi:molybdopterin converting factor subunit 1
MKVTVLAFGFTKDIIGQRFSTIELKEGSMVGDFRTSLLKQYPALSKMAVIRVAINSEYAEDDTPLNENDEVALIPPVSGG